MVSDASILEKVDRVLRNDIMLHNIDYWEIDVAVKEAVVSLSGNVLNTINHRQAEVAVRSVPGVQDVKNYLISDDMLVREVAAVLGKIEHTYQVKFSTGARHGVIVLNGTAPDASVRSLAENYAARIPGVRGVINFVQAPGIDLQGEDERFLQPLVGEPIYFRNGPSGKVDKVIINPNNLRVIAMVVRGQYPASQQDSRSLTYDQAQLHEKLVVIPVKAIRYLTRSSGFLSIDSTETARYKVFDLSGFVTPQDNWTPPYPYRRNDVFFPVESAGAMEQMEQGLTASPILSPRLQPAVPNIVPV